MKKCFFSLTFGALLLASSFAVFAMEEGDREMLQTDPVRIRFSSRGGFFRRNTSFIFAELRNEHFRINSDKEANEEARGHREIWIDDTEIKPLLQKLREAGMVIETVEAYSKKVNSYVMIKAQEEADKLFAKAKDKHFKSGRKAGLKEAEEGFLQRHPKKIIAGTILLTAVGTGALVHWWENR